MELLSTCNPGQIINPWLSFHPENRAELHKNGKFWWSKLQEPNSRPMALWPYYKGICLSGMFCLNKLAKLANLGLLSTWRLTYKGAQKARATFFLGSSWLFPKVENGTDFFATKAYQKSKEMSSIILPVWNRDNKCSYQHHITSLHCCYSDWICSTNFLK